MSAPTAAIGFARLPDALAQLLDESAINAGAAAGLLAELGRDPHRADVLDSIGECRRAGDRIAWDARRVLQGSLSLGRARADVLRLTAALDDVLEAIDSSAHAVAVFADALPDDRTRVVTAILRDLTRVSVQEVAGMNQPADLRDALQERAHERREEFRREVRRTGAAVVGVGAEPLQAARAEVLLKRLQTLSDANGRLSLAVQGVVASLT